MFDFRKIQLEDRAWINERLKISDFRGCEYCFANNMAWQRLSDTVICRHDDFYISCCKDKNRAYVTFPSGVKLDDTGKEKYIKLFSELKKHFENMGLGMAVSSVTQENLQWLKEYYGENISYTHNPDSSDYVYNSCDLAQLKGKKYHGKRNHIKHFKENDWSFEPVAAKNAEECIAFCTNIYNDSNGYNEFSKIVEQYAINLFFTNFNELDLKGGILKSGEKIVGVSLGERLNSDTFVVHIEKAKGEMQGAYQMLCSQMAETFGLSFRYINREEDMGIEGLRRSKRSYYPAFMVDKYTVDFK